MNPLASHTTSNEAICGAASNIAADPQNGSMYCFGLPNRAHTSDTILLFPPKYGKGARS
jgi:hypothetical protein